AAMADPKLVRDLEASVKRYPDEWLAAQQDYLSVYLNAWDREAQLQKMTGIAANDCHHNQVYLTKMVDAETVLVGTIVDKDEDMIKLTVKEQPGITELTKGHQPGDVLAKVDFDPYYIMLRNCATHILANELSEEAMRKALKAGHAYVSHDWMCDPTGFVFGAVRLGDNAAAPLSIIMGDEVQPAEGLKLLAEFPLSCHIRLLKNGEVVHEFDGQTLEHAPDGPGVYRVEGWVTLDDERRPWIYSNPVYVR
ncbi:MAG: histidinol phosphatase, partial [Candidatus Hydrogenedentes bacterium]|nr:histidinol phosphatase [Candidatus Hydrogenedentota bacterium]